jgi:ABC-type transport system involved in multi-copper enzyme maturation permease subunit
MFRMILWKEWQENLWKLAFCLACSVAFTVMLFRIRIIPDSSNCLIISMIQLFVVPVVYSLDIFSGEISNRTIHLLFKIPVKRRMLFFGKFLVSSAGILLVFIVTGIVMELMAGGRETPMLYLFGMNFFYGITALILFTWFCAFGCQSRSEAGSLIAMFSVFIGWAIVLFWAGICNVTWAQHFIPYSILFVYFTRVGIAGWAISQIFIFAVVLGIACYRYISIRRYL